jgi:gliding motility-associated lipoprotein GldH
MKRNKIIFLFSTVLLVSTLQFNCKDNLIYQSEIEIPDGIWKIEKAAVFKVDLTDSLKVYDIKLSVTNSADYRYSNIWFFIKSISPQGFAHIDTVEFFLSENDGKWLGEKSANMWTSNPYYKRQLKFPYPGNYTFEIIQGMRDTSLKGINRIGFEIYEYKGK